MTVLYLLLASVWSLAAHRALSQTADAYSQTTPCDTVNTGYQCSTEISHDWGQYSPYFSVPPTVPSSTPAGCSITFAQVLSRHGARDPTASKTKAYAALIDRVHTNATSYEPGYEFLRDYEYTLGADQLTTFGEQEMINSGAKFFQQYAALAANSTPFIRASSEDRVVESAQKFSQGFHAARLAADPASSEAYPYPILILSEATGSNNTLNHDLCTAFESDPDSSVGDDAQDVYAAIFTPPIADRLSENLPGVNFSTTDVISMMDLCPFNTVANTFGNVSELCALFTQDEWAQYGYYESLGKWYGYGPGNPLGPTQGVGFAAELLARITGDRSYVTNPASYTSINHTLDADEANFPLGEDVKLYADFSHDNDMTAIFSALGLFNGTQDLSNSTLEHEAETGGYSAAWTVPFAARAYFEKMTCDGETDELVRVLVNDRVVPLQGCDADKDGRCEVSKWVESLKFARRGGQWGECFV